MTRIIIVVGAEDAADDLRFRSKTIRVELPKAVRRIGKFAERQARHKSTGIFGENSGARSGRLVKAINAEKLEKTPTGWKCVVGIRSQPRFSSWYDKVVDPAEYATFVEHGTRAKIATGHGRPSDVHDLEMDELGLQHGRGYKSTTAFRGPLMIFSETRPSHVRPQWYSGHFFAGQRAKYFMYGSADETNHVFVPVAIRGIGTKRGIF